MNRAKELPTWSNPLVFFKLASVAYNEISRLEKIGEVEIADI